MASTDNDNAAINGDSNTTDMADRFEGSRIEELPSDDFDSEYEDIIDETEINGPPFPGKYAQKSTSTQEKQLPPWLQTSILPNSSVKVQTKTTEAQAEVTRDCLPLLQNPNKQTLPLNTHGLPHLKRSAHANFLHNTLRPLPAPYMLADASRPWMFNWALAGLSFLDEDISQYRERLQTTLRPLQHPLGGFGGGDGQMAHCAGTFAAVLALAAVNGLEIIDRRKLWHWLGRVKRSDGGFRMAIGAEEDIRGAYCAMAVIVLLNLPLSLPPDSPARTEGGLETFTDGLGEWISRCQTYEGGIGGAPDNEAHGAYAFCALATLCILDAPHVSIPRFLDARALLGWLAARQSSPEGGFAGRQEKLVDACYSHWVGGCWALLEAALAISPGSTDDGLGKGCDDIWNREAMIRYLLCCAQLPGQKKGGLRDKPSARPDGYHTAYSLAGLSHAQNRYEYDRDAPTRESAGSGRLLAAFNWKARRATRKELERWKVDEEDVVELVHPIFTLRMEAVELARELFADGAF